MVDENLKNPLFICGYPKSGTTLLISLLDGKSELLVIPEETHIFKRVFKKKLENWFYTLFNDTNIAVLRKKIVAEPSGKRDYTRLNFQVLEKSAYDYWEKTSKTGKDFFESFVIGLAESIGIKIFQYWVEKTPKTENYLKTIKKWWPLVKVIYIIRDPRETFCSHREYQKKKTNPLRVVIDDFILKWQKSITHFINYSRKNKNCILIRYEDLTKNPEIIMRNIAKFLNINYCHSMLVPTRMGIVWGGNSSSKEKFSNVKVKQMKYIQHLSIKERQKIEGCLQKYMKKFNYRSDYKLNLIKRFYYFFYNNLLLIKHFMHNYLKYKIYFKIK